MTTVQLCMFSLTWPDHFFTLERGKGFDNIVSIEWCSNTLAL